MKREQIIELWKSVGWNSLTDYHEYLKTGERLILDSLDPDLIDTKEFWKAADEHFSTDPVCNHNNFFERTLSIKESNKLNYSIPLYLGMLGQTEWMVSHLKSIFKSVSIAEIGCGYGSFFDNFFNDKHQDVDYRGFDIIPRISLSNEIEGSDGCFSDEQVSRFKERYNLFFSSNTFQHLSEKQIVKYLVQVYEMLPYEGYFNLMYAMSREKNYSYHYGQMIKLLDRNNLESKIKDIGYSIVGSANIQLPNSLTPFNLILKK